MLSSARPLQYLNQGGKFPHKSLRCIKDFLRLLSSIRFFWVVRGHPVTCPPPVPRSL